MRTRIHPGSIVSVLLLLITLSAPATARQSTTPVTGVVTDASGAVIAEATVDTMVAGRRYGVASSDREGRYRVEAPAGVLFELRVQRDGFATQTFTMPGATAPITRNVTLPVAGLSDTLIVTASRTAESRIAVTESVTAFTRQDIETLGSASLADIVRYTPAVNIEAAGREGAVTSMFTRGGESDYNLVLIDGVRVNLSGGGFDLSRISAADIERVEVVRGAQSALWGSDAMGAVVQVFTRRSGPTDAPQLSATAEGGSFGTMRGDARITGGAGGAVNYHAGLSRRDTDGAFQDRLIEDDTFSQVAYDAGGGVMLGTRGTLRGSVRYTTAEGRSVGQIVYGARDTGSGYETKDFTGSIDLAHTIGKRFVGSATYNDFRYQNRSFDTISDPPFSTYAILTGTPNALFPNGTRLVRLIDVNEFNSIVAAGAMPAPGQFVASRSSSDFLSNTQLAFTEFRRPAFRYQGDVDFGTVGVTGGYEWEREDNPAVADFRLNNQSAFIQARVAANDRWFATVGARVDNKDSYDTFFSPKLSAGGFLVPFRPGAVSSVKVFGNIGKGIKSPTFSERFGGSFADPSPDLKVERARTGDIGVESTFVDQRFMARVVYFNNDYLDQIAFRSGVPGDAIPEFINIDGSKADGVELEWALQRAIGGVTAAASYAYVDNRVVTNISTSQQFQPGQPLLRRPQHSGLLRASYARGRLTVAADARIVGDRHDNSFLSLRTVPNAQLPSSVTTDITVNPGYTVIGLGADVELHDTLTAYLRVANAGDEVYESALGYPGMPRTFVTGVRVRFGGR